MFPLSATADVDGLGCESAENLCTLFGQKYLAIAKNIWQLENSEERFDLLFYSGAGERTRTSDLLITNQLLYHLSYTGIGGGV